MRRRGPVATLAPGEVNHEVIANIDGSWRDCVVRGAIELTNGFERLHWDPSGEELKAKLFESPDLPDHWDRLDRFEGPDYRRLLIPVEIDRGMEIGYVYGRL